VLSVPRAGDARIPAAEIRGDQQSQVLRGLIGTAVDPLQRFTQFDDRLLVELHDQVVEVLKDDVEGTDGVTDAARDLAHGKRRRAALGDDFASSLQREVLQLLAAVFVASTHVFETRWGAVYARIERCSIRWY
jgi:hypothetical protein